MEHLLKCMDCKEYTMQKACPKCGKKTNPPKPPKWSPEDKYGGYRRTAKEQERKAQGVL